MFPPEPPAYWPDNFFGPSPYIPPILIPPPPIPCDDDPETPNPDCPPGPEEPPDPEEPPMEVPEPGILMILLAGLGAGWFATRRRRAA